MPVSKHRKKSKQNSFGIRKAQKWADEQRRLEQKLQFEPEMLDDRLENDIKQAELISEEVAQNEETE